MKPNLDKLENLSDDQLKKISNDVDTVGIRKAAEQASKDTDRSIDKTCIQRLNERCIAKRFLAESPDASQAATEILRFAVTGRPDFSEATVKVLEETAFKLSLQCAHSEDEMKALNSITVMLARYRNTSVRERMAKLQEEKLQFRRDEFEWKKSVHASKPAASDKSQIKNQKSKIQEDDLGRLAKTLDDVERRACEKFNLPCSAPSTDCSLAPARGEGQGEGIASVISVPSVVNNSPSVGDSAMTEPYLQSEKNSETPSAPNSVVAASSPVAASLQGEPYQTEKNSQAQDSSLPSFEKPEIQAPTASSPQSATADPYLQTEKNLPGEATSLPSVEKSAICNLNSKIKSHAIRRWRAHIPWPKGEPEPDGSWRNECPCGNPAPCAEHPELKTRVRCYKPQHPDYQGGLKEFNVPYYKPTAEEIGCTQAALDRSCDLFADNPRMKDPPHPAVDPFKKWIKRSDS